MIARGDWSWSRDQPVVRGNPRYWQGSRWQQRPRRRRSTLGPIFWLLRAVIGLTILASIWLLLQHLFPLGSPAPDEQPVIASDRRPPSGQDQQAAPTSDRGPTGEVPSAPAVEQDPPPQPPAERTEAIASQAQGQPTPPAPTAAPTQAAPTPAPTVAPPTQAAPTAAPVPPPPAPAEAPAQAAAPPAPPTDPPPAAPTTPPAPPPPLVVQVSLSPTEPTPRTTLVTVMIVVTADNEPIGGAACSATVAYRTATDRVPPGGFATGPDGIGTFTIETRGASFNFAVPVTVTCSADGRTASAETRFTPRER